MPVSNDINSLINTHDFYTDFISQKTETEFTPKTRNVELSWKQTQMYRYIICSVLILTSGIFLSLLAQPQEAWFRTYHNDNTDHFTDVYAAQNGGYVVCGETHPNDNVRDPESSMLVVKVDDNGEEIWTGLFGSEDGWDRGYSIIEADNGDYIVGGSSKINNEIYQCAVWRISPDGEEIWSNTYGLDWFYSVIELKNGHFLLSGRARRPALLVLINGDGDLIWRREYSLERSNHFASMRETDGGVVVAGYTKPRGGVDHDQTIWVLKIDPEREGEIIWSRTYEFGANQAALSIVSANGGFVISADLDNHLEGSSD